MHAYLVGHLRMTVDNDDDWLGRNPCTIQDVVDELAASAECEGHPAGEFDPMGRTVYCDGSCR